MGKLSKPGGKQAKAPLTENQNQGQQKISLFFQKGIKAKDENTSNLFTHIGGQLKVQPGVSNPTYVSKQGDLDSPICVEDDIGDDEIIPDTPKCDKLDRRNRNISAGTSENSKQDALEDKKPYQSIHENSKSCHLKKSSLIDTVLSKSSEGTPDRTADASFGSDCIPDTPKEKSPNDKSKLCQKSRSFLTSATEYMPKAFLKQKEKHGAGMAQGKSCLQNHKIGSTGRSLSSKTIDSSILPTTPLESESYKSGAQSLSMVMTDMGLYNEAQRALGVYQNIAFDRARKETASALKDDGMDISEYHTQEIIKKIKRSPSRGNSPNPKRIAKNRTTPNKLMERCKMKLNMETSQDVCSKPLDKYALFNKEKEQILQKSKGNTKLEAGKWGLTKNVDNWRNESKKCVPVSEPDHNLDDIMCELKSECPKKEKKKRKNLNKFDSFSISSMATSEISSVKSPELSGQGFNPTTSTPTIPEDDGLDDIMAELRSQYSSKKTDLKESLTKVSRPAHHKLSAKKVKRHTVSKKLFTATLVSPVKQTINTEEKVNIISDRNKDIMPMEVASEPDKEISCQASVQVEPADEDHWCNSFEEALKLMDETNSNQGLEKFPPAFHQFGRHKVTNIIQVGYDTHLEVCSEIDASKKACVLQGFWSDTHVKRGDIVNIIGKADEEGTFHITDKENLIVIHPDLLLSGTSVVSCVNCMRRSVLNEKFKGTEGSNIYMLHGSIVHSFFQQVLQEEANSEEVMKKIAADILQQPGFQLDMYGQGVTEASVLEVMEKFIPQILKFIHQYVPPKLHTFGQRKVVSDLTISNIADIEENVWSPRYGVKGKIDLTVEVKIHDKKHISKEKKLMPLELKTGRASYSIEHKGQVTLYSMMCSDRREDPEGGLLLYLKEGTMKVIPADHANKGGLIQLRNELAHYLKSTLEKVDSDSTRMTGEDEVWDFGSLPKTIDNERWCSNCPQLLNCAAYQKCVERVEPPESHIMSTLVPAKLAHLTSQHLTYFSHWCRLLHLEQMADTKKGPIRDIWCKSGWQREEEGLCLSGLSLTDVPVTQGGPESYTHVFYRKSRKALSLVGLSLNENILISGENKPYVALSRGVIIHIAENTVTVIIDRNLKVYKDYSSTVYRIDKCDNYNSMGSNFTSLSRLMEDTPIHQRLRELIIGKKPPCFDTTMSKNVLGKVKDVFKHLNKPQKTAILKVLMSQDYVLIKGYPGTGKTSTIVTLVRVLVLLGQSVLLTSYTHSAVDNILLKLKNFNVDFVRLGRIEKIHPEIRQHSAAILTENITNVAGLAELYENKPVVATTCLGTNHVLFSKRTFDVCIVDEASQVLEPTCLGPLYCSRKFVLVGDPLQLPPVVQSTEARKLGMSESLFAKLDDMGGTYELNLQYRMNSEIMRLSNELVYNGALKCGSKSCEDSRLNLPHFNRLLKRLPEWLKTSISPEQDKEVIFLNTDNLPMPDSKSSKDSGVQNKTEAFVIHKMCVNAVEAGLNPEDIGIIAPYQQQVKLLRETLHSSSESGNHLGNGLNKVEVNTVDQYQGRDKDMIVVSFVKSYSTDGPVSQILKDVRRLNVALTRAKHKLVLVGSRQALGQYDPLEKLLDILRHDQVKDADIIMQKVGQFMNKPDVAQ